MDTPAVISTLTLWGNLQPLSLGLLLHSQLGRRLIRQRMDGVFGDAAATQQQLVVRFRGSATC